MWYCYVLQSVGNRRLYVGVTSDLRQRFKEHNSLIFYEAYLRKKDALQAERFYKSGYGREILRQKLQDYLGGDS